MKITLDSKVRDFILAAAFITGLGLGTSAFAQVQHAYLIDLNSKTATDIGALGGSYTQASDINDAGQVVGSSGNLFDDTHAFITGADGVGIEGSWHLGRYLQQCSWHQRCRPGGRVLPRIALGIHSQVFHHRP